MVGTENGKPKSYNLIIGGNSGHNFLISERRMGFPTPPQEPPQLGGPHSRNTPSARFPAQTPHVASLAQRWKSLAHEIASFLPVGRTGHACVQCRQRKQKCGGFTYGIKCRPCTNRKVKCSFDEEVKDPRHYPYLRLRSSKSPPIRRERNFAQHETEDAGMMARGSLSLSPLQSDPISTSLPTELVNETASSNDDGLLQQVEMLKSRQVFLVGIFKDIAN
ncbi:unnamed protein product [Penicillium pancosmium]